MRLLLRHVTATCNNHLQGISLHQGVAEMKHRPSVTT